MLLHCHIFKNKIENAWKPVRLSSVRWFRLETSKIQKSFHIKPWATIAYTPQNYRITLNGLYVCMLMWRFHARHHFAITFGFHLLDSISLSLTRRCACLLCRMYSIVYLKVPPWANNSPTWLGSSTKIIQKHSTDKNGNKKRNEEQREFFHEFL